MRVYLIGFMGVGKTSLAKELAKNLSCPFIDIDNEIEKRTGIPVREYFTTKGEESFRMLETNVLRDIKTDCVVSCGGGTACYHDNMNWMNKQGVTIYLDADFSTIRQRIKGKEGMRPLLVGKEESDWRKLFESRKACYNQAQYKLLTDGKSKNEVLREACDLLRKVNS